MRNYIIISPHTGGNMVKINSITDIYVVYIKFDLLTILLARTILVDS